MFNHTVGVVVAVWLTVASGATMRAHDATPQASPVAGGEMVDLAAMTLDSSVMPDEFTFSGESFSDLQAMAERYTTLGAIASFAEFAALGITADYASYYDNEDFTRTIRTYVTAYSTEAAVQAGFDVLQNESVTVAEGTGTWEDEPGLAGVGEAPAEVTMVTLRETVPTTDLDITFRVGRIQAGVSLQIQDLVGQGVAISQADRDLLEGLAKELERRVTAVLAGEQLSGIDATLPALVPTIAVAFSQDGYLTASEAKLDQATAFDAAAFRSAYQRLAFVVADDPHTHTHTTPHSVLTVAVARFGDAGAAQAALDHADEVVPSEGQFARDELTEVAGHPAAGYVFVSPFGIDQTDSFRVYVAVDDLLVWVSLEGTDSVEWAEELTLDFAADAVACVTEGRSCASYNLPDLSTDASSVLLSA